MLLKKKSKQPNSKDVPFENSLCWLRTIHFAILNLKYIKNKRRDVLFLWWWSACGKIWRKSGFSLPVVGQIRFSPWFYYWSCLLTWCVLYLSLPPMIQPSHLLCEHNDYFLFVLARETLLRQVKKENKHVKKCPTVSGSLIGICLWN